MKRHRKLPPARRATPLRPVRGPIDLETEASAFLQQLVKLAPTTPTIAKVYTRVTQGLPKKRKVTVDFKIVGASAMRRLNYDFRKKDRATDVLSFGVPPDFVAATGCLGELVVCRPVLSLQAREQGHTRSEELKVLLVHGFLHLLGFDHALGPKEARRMAAAEAKLLTATASRTRPKGLIARGLSIR